MTCLELAIASSTLMAIAKAKLKVNAVSVACIVDNAIGAKGTLPESIIKSLNGKTVQIDNTDAEGRLIWLTESPMQFVPLKSQILLSCLP